MALKQNYSSILEMTGKKIHNTDMKWKDLRVHDRNF